MQAQRTKIENGYGLGVRFDGVGFFDNDHYIFAPTVDDVKQSIANNQNDHEKVSSIIKNYFHIYGFTSLLSLPVAEKQTDEQRRQEEAIEILAVNVGLKTNASLSQEILNKMKGLYSRVVAENAVAERPNLFVVIQNIFRECRRERMDNDGDFYKMAAIALAQLMLTSSCFTASRSSHDASVPKTWKLLMMEARVFIGSLSDTDNRRRVLLVFQKAITEQEGKFILAASQHSLVQKLKDPSVRAEKIERFMATLANCSELFNPDIIDESSLEQNRQERLMQLYQGVNDSSDPDYDESRFDLKKFGDAKLALADMLKDLELRLALSEKVKGLYEEITPLVKSEDLEHRRTLAEKVSAIEVRIAVLNGPRDFEEKAALEQLLSNFGLKPPSEEARLKSASSGGEDFALASFKSDAQGNESPDKDLDPLRARPLCATNLIKVVTSYLQKPLLSKPQSMSQAIFSIANMTTMFRARCASEKKVSYCHPPMVWVQLVTYARLLAEKSSNPAGCLKELYQMVKDMAVRKGWGQAYDHFYFLNLHLEKAEQAKQIPSTVAML